MKRYFRVYKTLLRLNLLSMIMYRGNFFNSLASTVFWTFFSLFAIFLLTTKASQVYDWTRTEMFLLTGVWTFVWGFFHTFLARNFERFERLIDYGELDTILTKPLDSQFSLSLWYINYTGLFRTLLGVFIIGYMVVTNQIQLSFINVISFSVLMLVGFVLIYSIWFITATFLIWFPRLSNLIEFLYTYSGASRYPPDIYREFKNYMFLFLLPVAIFVSTPTKALVNKALAGEVMELVLIAAGFMLFSRWFWKFGLKSYTSASS